MRFMFVVPSVAVMQELYGRLASSGSVFMLHPGDVDKDRANMMRAFHETPGSTLITTVHVTQEGWNVPDDTVLLSSLDFSFPQLAQLQGRMHRPRVNRSAPEGETL